MEKVVFNAPPLGRVLGRSWRSFCLIFSPSFLTSIFHRFLLDFGRVLGGQSGPKIEIFAIFLDMLVETSFLVEFCQIFDKIDGEKHRDFQ